MKNSNPNFFENLNENQKKSVIDLNGPCLIVAGAGSGKTRVLTTRVAYIIKEQKAWSNQILCVTFTNKAAREMQDRISKLLHKQNAAIPWLGTFHSLSAKFLRRHATAANLNPNFTIVDQNDQLKLIRNICKIKEIDTKEISPKFVITVINNWKNKG